MKKTNQAIKMSDAILLLQNGFIDVPEGAPRSGNEIAIGTIVSNMAYFGFVPSKAIVDAMSALTDVDLVELWAKLKPAFKYVTAADRKMGKFVVYKNFPKEVLSMSEGEYWLKQILMYWGLPNELFTEEKEPREPIYEKISPKVLDLADDETRLNIFNKLTKQSSDWTDFQKEQAGFLMKSYPSAIIDLDAFTQKTNGIKLIASAWSAVLNGERSVKVSTATDVMRLAAALSDIDVSLRTVSKFRKFSRSERRLLVSLLDGASNLEGDFALRAERWKRLLSFIRPGEFKFDKVKAAYDRLYKGELKTVATAIEVGLLNKDVAVLKVLKTRPGEFMRRLHKTYAIFGRAALEMFVSVIGNLSVSQLVKLDGYLSSVNSRKTYIVTPSGSWAKAQVIDNKKAHVAQEDLSFIRSAISAEIGRRLKGLHPDGFAVAADTLNVKLQGNGQELAPYGRGTVFDIPQGVTFMRTASYWQNDRKYGHVWFDNGFNFFGHDWSPKGSVCWNSVNPFGDGRHWGSKNPQNPGCVFSGDPTNAKELKGRACQMIDLYPQELIEKGVRYAVWNILAYSNIMFSDAKDVVASLQWGEDAETGAIYEPSRAQMVFPITGKALTKFVAYIDLIERKLVYLDIGLSGSVQSARDNEKRLSRMMPSIVEHLDTLPSIAELFGHAVNDKGIPVVSNDEGLEINGPAYVFKRLNADNNVEQIDIEEILKAISSTTA
jgi:hypothetical protein